jgi:peptidylprolyl isomerase domain and WD repeat-containing protein 1
MTDTEILPDPIPKKRKLDDILISELPNTDQYETSFMHRDVLSFVFVTKTDFLITCSVDGHVKFWKKQAQGIEFVKHYRAHTDLIKSCSVSHDGMSFATCSPDQSIKVFDVVNFDMINMFKIDYLPYCVEWVSIKSAMTLLACSEMDSQKIHIYDGRGNGFLYFFSIHSSPVHLMKFNPVANCVVSIDERGMVEYWTPKPDDFIEDYSGKGYSVPDERFVSWSLKSDTDLYEFKKNRTTPCSLEFSRDYSKFVTFDWKTRQIRIFSFKSGKLLKKIDESLEAIEACQKEQSITKMDDMEFGRRLTVEREIDSGHTSVIFDESGKFIIYPSIWGIKIVNFKTGELKSLVGKSETIRFMNIALYQGAPRKKQLMTVEMAASDNSVLREAEETDPTLFGTAFKKSRFYIFSRREPDTESASSRDIFNEKPAKEEQVIAKSKVQLVSSCIIHTTFGDIYCRLFPEYAPKAVENFITLSKQGYYDNNKWHRCIKGFMIQSGDPLGDGTGGQSCWGLDFEDEFNSNVRHDRPYTISMANSGPNTNGSQVCLIDLVFHYHCTNTLA